ncbi:hypothetical protein ABZS66_38805 [Dactylosporangium sp. NPDC005572]|uniref:hypothetical protein n=1 Tax=Dactylosporangium sp. NPDC005572 TaxID=3156889 RepID=UPI0033AB80EB
MRQLFYVVVLLVALAGQVTGAVQALGIPLIWAIPAVAALELGGIVVLANADVRRRLGERATASRFLSALIAAFAVAFNWMAHDDKLLAGFFAGMSALGYLVWLMHTENQRRDRLRAKGDLPPTTPAYEVVGHWIRHPWMTLRAKNLAKADTKLGLYTSLAAARAEKRKEQRTAAIAKVLHRKIRSAVDPTTADIAVAVYDLDEIALRLANGADYDGLTALIAADLAPARLAANGVVEQPPGREREIAPPEPEIIDTEEQLALPEAATVIPVSAPPSVSPLGELRTEIEGILPPQRKPRSRSAVAEITEIAEEPTLNPPPIVRDGSLRSQVHQLLHEHIPPGDQRDVVQLTTFVGDLLDLDDVERLTASNYVRTWKREVDAGRRAAVNGRHLEDVIPAKR